MRIVIDPEELNRFAAFNAEAADDHATRAGRLRTVDIPPMPPEVERLVRGELDRIATVLDVVATTLYAEALMSRSRAGMLDPTISRYLIGSLGARPG